MGNAYDAKVSILPRILYSELIVVSESRSTYTSQPPIIRPFIDWAPLLQVVITLVLRSLIEAMN